MREGFCFHYSFRSHHHPISGSIDARNIKWSCFMVDLRTLSPDEQQEPTKMAIGVSGWDKIFDHVTCLSQKSWLMKDSLLSCFKPYLVSPSKSGSSFWRWTNVFGSFVAVLALRSVPVLSTLIPGFTICSSSVFQLWKMASFTMGFAPFFPWQIPSNLQSSKVPKVPKWENVSGGRWFHGW